MAITQKLQSLITISGNCGHYGGQFMPFFTGHIFLKFFQDIANLLEAYYTVVSFIFFFFPSLFGG